MKRGCVMLIIAISTIILVASVLLYLFVWPKVKVLGTSSTIYTIERGLADYLADGNPWPEGDNAAITKILMGENEPRRKQYLPPSFEKLVRDGELCDLWQQPLLFGKDSDGAPQIRSAGKNGDFGDADDVTKSDYLEELRTAEERRQ